MWIVLDFDLWVLNEAGGDPKETSFVI